MSPESEENVMESRSIPSEGWTLVAVAVGVFLLLLDITIVNVALPFGGYAL